MVSSPEAPVAITPAALAEAVVALIAAHQVGEAEVALAALTGVLLTGLETGQIPPAAADQFYTALDVRLAQPGGETPLSEPAQELIFEGEQLHHFGDAYGPDPAYLRHLAAAILHRRAPAAE